MSDFQTKLSLLRIARPERSSDLLVGAPRPAKACINCNYYVPKEELSADEIRGECRINPPKHDPIGEHGRLFPITLHTDFCGDHST